VLGQHRSTQRKIPRGPEDEEQLTDDLVALVREHGRLDYRKTAALLRSTSDWVINDKRVELIWRQEGLKVLPQQPKRSRIWPSDGTCTRLRAERPNHSGPTTSWKIAPMTGEIVDIVDIVHVYRR
jgi:putative transposase